MISVLAVLSWILCDCIQLEATLIHSVCLTCHVCVGSPAGEHNCWDVRPAARQRVVNEEWFTSPRRAGVLHHLPCRPGSHQTHVSAETAARHCRRCQRGVGTLWTTPVLTFNFVDMWLSDWIIAEFLTKLQQLMWILFSFYLLNVYILVVIFCLCHISI